MTSKGILEWLLEESQPAVRYLALTQYLGKPKDDTEAQKAKKKIPEKGWAADILREQRPSGMWVSDQSLYRPKYLSTNWMLLVLSDLGMTRSDPRIAQGCDLWIRR